FARIWAPDNLRRLSAPTKPASRAAVPPMPKASAAMRHFTRSWLNSWSSLPAGLRAHLILGLARRSGIVLHAGGPLLGAQLATRLFGTRHDAGAAQSYQRHECSYETSHPVFPLVLNLSSSCSRSCRARRARPWRA